MIYVTIRRVKDHAWLHKRWFASRTGWIAALVGAHGLLIIIQTLLTQIRLRHLPAHIYTIDLLIDVPLLLGMSLLYSSIFLRRRKRNAWVFTTALYVFLLGLNTASLIQERPRELHLHALALLLPLVVLSVLLVCRKYFIVRSDSRSFATSLRVALVVLLAMLLYGTLGFLLMDQRDFHQEITPLRAVHYTVDQFDLTTNPLHAYSKRASLFLDSLSFISISAVGFVFVSLFQPLSARYVHHKGRAELARRLVYKAKADSEDFFKLWPHDKAFLFSADEQAGIAYKVHRGVALAVGAPFGRSASITNVLRRFEDLCFVNDWRPAFIHVSQAWLRRFTKRGYHMQLIGREAIVDLSHFERVVATTKYFREIANRFAKLSYSTELLSPPHHTALVDRLHVISDEWLERPGRVERGYMMGYFAEAYLQQCEVFVVRDAAGTIQAFLNLLPSPVLKEANFDLLRNSKHAPGNINDYLLMQLMLQLKSQGTQRLNMGLCPLAGIEEEPNTLINRTLRFVYSAGNRVYSFQGLYRFKAKYEPDWSERYVVYKGGVGDFTRVMSALYRAMKVKL